MKLHSIVLIVTILFTINGCYSDPGGKFYMMIIGFPILGVLYFIYEAVFGSKKDK